MNRADEFFKRKAEREGWNSQDRKKTIRLATKDGAFNSGEHSKITQTKSNTINKT